MKKIFTVLSFLLLVFNTNAQAPDLKTGVSFSYGWTPGPNEINLSWDFFNVGGGTANTFTIAYIASLDMNIDAGDYLIEGVAYGGAVANAFATINYSTALAPDALPTGNYNFIVFIDYGNDVAESNETNNIVKFGSFNFTNQTAGIHKNNGSFVDLTVYPNPAEEKLNLSLNLQSAVNNCNYVLCDLLGKEVLTGEINTEALTGKKEIDLTEIPSGVYFLNLRTGESVIESKKIMVR
jgi:hypothetical protein